MLKLDGASKLFTDKELLNSAAEYISAKNKDGDWKKGISEVAEIITFLIGEERGYIGGYLLTKLESMHSHAKDKK